METPRQAQILSDWSAGALPGGGGGGGGGAAAAAARSPPPEILGAPPAAQPSPPLTARWAKALAEFRVQKKT
eukprot:COSAG01_NODE_37350_length_504_cov_9.162963_1_plen_71_part_10